jgi:NTE family protein
MGVHEPRVDLVFEGGGVKGIGLAGAHAALESHGYKPQCVAGTSAGAITAALVAVGYTGSELVRLVTAEMKFPKFADSPRFHLPGIAGDLEELLRHRGIHPGDYFLNWIRQKLNAKGKTTFGELRDDGATDESRRYRLQVIASDLSDHSMLVLPRDAGRLGIDPDKLEIALAVRMSMSIPVFFRPVVHVNPQTGGGHLIVDGGLLSNFPVWLFDAPPGTSPKFPTLGVMLLAKGQTEPVMPAPPAGAGPPKLPSFPDFIKSLADTAMQAHDRFYLEDENFARTIPVPTLGVSTTEFDITPEKTLELIQAGRDATEKFLAAWDFQAYVAKYRTPDGTPPH